MLGRLRTRIPGLHTARVAGSNPAPPTIKTTASAVFLCPDQCWPQSADRVTCDVPRRICKGPGPDSTGAAGHGKARCAVTTRQALLAYCCDCSDVSLQSAISGRDALYTAGGKSHDCLAETADGVPECAARQAGGWSRPGFACSV